MVDTLENLAALSHRVLRCRAAGSIPWPAVNYKLLRSTLLRAVAAFFLANLELLLSVLAKKLA